VSKFDKFFNSTAARVLSAVAIIWSAIELGRWLKDKYDARKGNVVDVDAK
jgi:hypothetical protein